MATTHIAYLSESLVEDGVGKGQVIALRIK